MDEFHSVSGEIKAGRRLLVYYVEQNRQRCLPIDPAGNQSDNSDAFNGVVLYRLIQQK